MAQMNHKSKCVVWSKWLARWLFCGFLFYLAVLLLGLIPVNNGFSPAEEGIEIFVVSNAVHADIIVPVSTEEIDWLEQFDNSNFPSNVSEYSHVAIGWGDRGFFLETPTWADFKLSTAAKALFLPTPSCLHVTFTRPELFREAPSVKIAPGQYKELVAFVRRSLKTDEARNPIAIPGYSYSATDTFFETYGMYHLFNTCNSWAGQALKAAGIRVPWISPIPKTPELYLPTVD